MKKNTRPTAPKKIKPVDSTAKKIVPDDRLGSDEPLDEANDVAGSNENTASGHRVRKIESNDEHNNENLIEEGLQGRMHGSLTKPRKTK